LLVSYFGKYLVVTLLSQVIGIPQIPGELPVHLAGTDMMPAKEGNRSAVGPWGPESGISQSRHDGMKHSVIGPIGSGFQTASLQQILSIVHCFIS
jgi:hypothetical protein